MSTRIRLQDLAANVSECTWLAALIVVPSLFVAHTQQQRMFEADKAVAMRLTALLIAAALVVLAFAEGRRGVFGRTSGIWKVAVVRSTIGLAACWVLATVFSVAPRISFWGDHVRRQGTYTHLSYLVVFLAVVILLHERRQVRILTSVLLIASVFPSLYACWQAWGIDPLPWVGQVFSTAGNRIFVAAFLIMVWPVTLARAIEAWTPSRANENSGVPSSRLLQVASYVALLIVQSLALIYARSRGPTVGWVAGVVLFGLLTLRPAQSRLVRRASLAAGALVLAAALAVANWSLLSGWRAPAVARLHQITTAGTSGVRVLVWQGVVELLAEHPARLFLGYGPETLALTFQRHYPADITLTESQPDQQARVDRAHNEMFDSMATIGAIGTLAEMCVFLSIFCCGLRWLERIGGRRQQVALLGAAVAGSILAGLLSWTVDGGFRFFGVAIPMGLVSGLFLYLLVGHNPDSRDTTERADRLLLAALLSGICAHFVEIQFGIATTATLLYFWVYAGLAVVIGARFIEATARANTARMTRTVPPASSKEPVSNDTIGLMLIVSLVLEVLTFDFYTPVASVHRAATLFLAVWVCAGVLVASHRTASIEHTGGVTRRRAWPRSLIAYAVATLVPWLAFYVLYASWFEFARGTSQIDLRGNRFGNTVTVAYSFTLMLILLTAIALSRRSHQSTGGEPGRKGLMISVWPILAAIVWAIIPTLNVSRAAIIASVGDSSASVGEWAAAGRLYERSVQLQPQDGPFLMDAGRMLVERARKANPPTERQAFLEQAFCYFERGRVMNPLDAAYPRYLANMQREWARLSVEQGERLRHLSEADRLYAQAADISPASVSLWNDWAIVDLDRGRDEEALAKLSRSVALNDRWAPTFALRARIAVKRGDFERAAADYQRVEELGAARRPELRAYATALAKLDRLPDAINADKKALALAPDDYETLADLVLLYERSQEYETALRWAEDAGRVGNAAERASMRRLIERIQTDMRNQAAERDRPSRR